jgi:hypothetical protein
VERLTFRPMKLETVVVMRGEKVAGTIRRYRAHHACVVSVPGLLTASMAIGQGKATFPNVPAAKARLLELDELQRREER